jgi:rubredoxin
LRVFARFVYYFCNREKRKSLTNKNNKIMDKYVCNPCGRIYDPAVGDPENGIEAGTAFENLPEDWVCPLCGAGKELFEQID